MVRVVTIAAFVIIIISLGMMAHADVTITSPNGRISAVVSVASGKLCYTAYKDGKPAYDQSSLGITISDIKLGESVTSVSGTSPIEINRTYPYRGVKATAVDHCNEVTLSIDRMGTGDQSFQMVWRAYDDGIAYRYQIPGFGLRSINGEATNWVLPSGTKIWYQNGTDYYEGFHTSNYIDNFYSYIGMPTTIALRGGSYASGYALISEAALFNYSGMTLRKNNGARTLQGVFQDDNYNAVTPYTDYCLFYVNGGSYSPWRATMLVDTLNDLVNSTLIANLAPPPSPALVNASWIKPGRCLWSWWAHDDVYTNPDRQKTYIDAAVTLGFDSVLWDEGWKTWTDSKINELLTYAKARNKTVWLWKKSSELSTESAMESFLQYIDGKNSLMGAKVIAGIKVDFMNSERIDTIVWYEMAMRKTAEHQLMVNFHGANKPTGESITWPNEITREGVRGLEYHKWAGEDNPPSHNATIPFVRNVVGHADYTPCSLTTATGTTSPCRTTHCHQLATAVIFTSPLTHWAEDPYYYINSPAVDIIRTCPSIWDETRVLPMSDIGTLAVFARRTGSTWYLAALNGDLAAAKNLAVKLDFLGEGIYEAVICSDNAANAYSMIKTTKYVSSSDTLTAWLGGGTFSLPKSGQYGGGYVVRLTPTTGISAYKTSGDGTSVQLQGRVVTAAFSDYLYVEEPDRSTGIRVVTSQTGFAPGDVVTVSGTMVTRKSGSVVIERQITAVTNGITKLYSISPLRPLLMNARNLGGNNIANSSGLSTVGLLVKITGKVTGKNGDMLYVDDGSGVADPDDYAGVAVKYASTSVPYNVGDWVSVTGVQEGSVGADGRTRRFVRARAASDVVQQ